MTPFFQFFLNGGGTPTPVPLPSNFRADPFQATLVSIDTDPAEVDPFKATLVP